MTHGAEASRDGEDREEEEGADGVGISLEPLEKVVLCDEAELEVAVDEASYPLLDFVLWW